ncbi:SSF domain containing protein, partial [Asbolus verrucosus]
MMAENTTILETLTTILPKLSQNVTKVSFSWYDYILFCLMLGLSALIGVYFGCFGLFLYLPIVIYIPALAFSAATGISVHYITPVVCGVCIFYTTLGGLKAVVWTDTLQFTVTLGAVITVFFLGVKSAGGFGAVWAKAIEGHRLDIFDFDPDPTKRDSFWIVIIGISMTWLSLTGIHQSCVQKFLSLPTLREAKLSVIYLCIGIILVSSFSIFTGLIIINEKTSSYILKLIVIIIGVICTGLVFILEHLGGLLPLAISLGGVTAGPLLGMFTLGVLFPKASSKGALYGYDIEEPKKFKPFFLFRISYYYYTLLGTVVTIICALLISYTLNNDDPPVHRDLLSPVIYSMLSDEKSDDEKKDYYSLDKALHL